MQGNLDNANEVLSNMINIFNNGFFKLYNIYNYRPGEYFSIRATNGFVDYSNIDPESNELILVIYEESTSSEFGLYPNGELKTFEAMPE